MATNTGSNAASYTRTVESVVMQPVLVPVRNGHRSVAMYGAGHGSCKAYGGLLSSGTGIGRAECRAGRNAAQRCNLALR